MKTIYSNIVEQFAQNVNDLREAREKFASESVSINNTFAHIENMSEKLKNLNEILIDYKKAQSEVKHQVENVKKNTDEI